MYRNIRPRGDARLLATAGACVVLLLALSACSDEDVNPVRVVFDLTTAYETDLYAVPYPNDLRVDSKGTIDLAGLPDQLEKDQDLVKLYLDTVAANRLGGFALNGGAHFRFDAAIDEQSLPASPADSLRGGSGLRWLNIDKDSAGYGTAVPVQWQYAAKAQTYIGAHSLAVVPVPGFPLEPATTYAVLLTEVVTDEAGRSVLPSADFELLLRDTLPDGAGALAAAHKTYAPLRTFLADTGLTGVVGAALFTTGDPTSLAGKARAVVLKGAAPTAKGLELFAEGVSFYEIHGTYDAPNFQAGTVPYLTPKDGGEIKLDSKGNPKPARTETLRFAISIPKGTMPADGWPVVLYAHGTGGSYRTFLINYTAERLSEVKDDSGQVITRFAVVGIDQNLHGKRAPGSSPEVTFFNLQNPVAAVHNVVQAGIDEFSRLRMVKGLTFSELPWSKDSGKTGTMTFSPAVKLDPKRIYFMGHSQGGLTGPVFLAHEPGIPAAVLSGAGGGAMLGLLGKTEPLDVRTILELALGEKVDMFHPLMNLVQQMLEPADTSNYGRMLIRHPAKGVSPKHIFLSQGFTDNYTPNDTTDALAAAIGVPLAGKPIRPVAALKLRGLESTSVPLAGNLTVGGKAITGALLQYQATRYNVTCKTKTDCTKGDYCDDKGYCSDDGHFVMFSHKTAIKQYSRFLATAARDGVPTIP